MRWPASRNCSMMRPATTSRSTSRASATTSWRTCTMPMVASASRPSSTSARRTTN